MTISALCPHCSLIYILSLSKPPILFLFPQALSLWLLQGKNFCLLPAPLPNFLWSCIQVKPFRITPMHRFLSLPVIQSLAYDKEPCPHTVHSLPFWGLGGVQTLGHMWWCSSTWFCQGSLLLALGDHIDIGLETRVDPYKASSLIKVLYRSLIFCILVPKSQLLQ